MARKADEPDGQANGNQHGCRTDKTGGCDANIRSLSRDVVFHPVKSAVYGEQDQRQRNRNSIHHLLRVTVLAPARVPDSRQVQIPAAATAAIWPLNRASSRGRSALSDNAYGRAQPTYANTRSASETVMAPYHAAVDRTCKPIRLRKAARDRRR